MSILSYADMLPTQPLYRGSADDLEPRLTEGIDRLEEQQLGYFTYMGRMFLEAGRVPDTFTTAQYAQLFDYAASRLRRMQAARQVGEAMRSLPKRDADVMTSARGGDHARRH
jgi:hypothetical protein